MPSPNTLRLVKDNTQPIALRNSLDISEPRKDKNGHYTSKFKEEVFQYYLSVNGNMAQTARVFGISKGLINYWKNRFDWIGQLNKIKNIKETIRPMETHIQDVFNYFYALGPKRSISLLSEKTKIPVSTLNIWSTKFSWSEVVKQRDQHINACVQAKQDATIIEEKSDYRKEIKEALQTTKQIVRTTIDPITNYCNLKVKSIKDLNDVTSIMERLIKLDMMLAGEEMISTQNNTQVNITIGNT